jgi:bifunctional non-homologous end joining protein LigD
MLVILRHEYANDKFTLADRGSALRTIATRRAMRYKNSLQLYRAKRKTTSPEPRSNTKSAGKIFVVQKHAASHLHYDFRFEYRGVLRSWAIPKGISSKLGIKHLAVPTEDHPRSYSQFEGVIPSGHYGAGVVMVWDIGTYKPLKISATRIELWLEGKKMKGGYALIQAKRKTGEKFWLFLKMKDQYANKALKQVTKSALTGRTMKQILREDTDA